MERELEFLALSNKNVLVYAHKDAIGDLLAWIPSIDIFQQTYKCNLFLCVNKIIRDIVEKQYQNIRFIEKDEIEKYKFDKILNIKKDARKDIYSRIEIEEGLINIGKKYFKVDYKEEISPKFDLSHEREIIDPYVCISTSATKYLKLWNYPGGWSAVIDYLKRILGYRVITLGQRKREIYSFEFKENDERKKEKIYKSIYKNTEDFTGNIPLQKRIDLIKDADFFIGTSSGLSWLAWGCKVPVVMISGFTEPFNEFYTPYRLYPTCGCRGCNTRSNIKYGITPIDTYRCTNVIRIKNELIPECSMNITPQMVIDKINQIPCVQSRLIEYWKNNG